MGERKAITNRLLNSIANHAVMAARDNAAVTVLENHPASEGRGDTHPRFDEYYRATLEGILDDSLRNPRSCSDYWPSDREARPLTDKQIATVRKFAGK